MTTVISSKKKYNIYPFKDPYEIWNDTIFYNVDSVQFPTTGGHTRHNDLDDIFWDILVEEGFIPYEHLDDEFQVKEEFWWHYYDSQHELLPHVKELFDEHIELVYCNIKDW